MDHKHEEILMAVHRCMEACNECYDACLNEKDVTHLATCIRLDRECADICNYLEQAITRNSPIIKELAQACVTACEMCYEECSKHDHEHCKKCAAACREAADKVKEIAIANSATN